MSRTISNTVGTYNIFITTSMRTALKFGKWRGSYTAFVNDLGTIDPGGPHAFLSTGGRGAKLTQQLTMPGDSAVNILEFAHQFNWSGGGSKANKDSGFKIKTHEPGMGFLKKIFFLEVGEQIEKLKHRKAALKDVGLWYEASRSNYEFLNEQRDAAIAAGLRFSPTGRTAIGGDWHGWSNSQEADWEQSKINQDIKDKERNLVLNEYVRGTRVFIAYGIGDDLSYWGGPFQCILGEVQYSNDGKKETVEYYFASDQVRRIFETNNPLDANPNVSINTSKYFSIPVVAYDTIPWTGPGGHTVPQNFSINGELVNFDGYTPSIHDCIVKLISYYLQSLGITNHIIVLPNLDAVLSPFIQSVLWEYLPRKGDLGGRLKGGPKEGALRETVMEEGTTSMPWKHPDPKTHPSVLAQKIWQAGTVTGLHEAGRTEYVNKGTEGHAIFGEPPHNKQYSFKDHLNIIKRIFANLGTAASMSSSTSVDDIDPRLVRITKGEKTQTKKKVGTRTYSHIKTFTDYKDIFIPDPFTAPGREKNADTFISIGLDLTQWEIMEKRGTSSKKTGTGVFEFDKSNYMTPIVNFITSILTSQGDTIYDIDYHYEDDINIQALLKDKFGSGTFAGYMHARGDRTDLVGGSVPYAGDNNYLIFGDKNLIDQYLYGSIYHIVEYNSKFRELGYLEKNQLVPIVDNRSIKEGGWGTSYLLDPFWNVIQDDLVGLEEVAKGVGVPVGDPATVGIATKSNLKSYMDQLGTEYFGKMQKIIHAGHYTPLGFFNDYSNDWSTKTKKEFVRVLPDEFGFINADSGPGSILDQIYMLRIPFFIANDENSNILSFNLDADNFLIQHLMGTIGDIYFQMAQRYSSADYVLGGVPSSDDIDKKIYEILDKWRAKGFYGKGFHAFFPDKSKAKFAKLTNDLKDILLLETEYAPGTTRNSRTNYSSPYVLLVTLFASLFRQRYKGVLKTLPMFNISTAAHLLKPAMVLLKSTPKMKTTSELDRSTFDFFSGLYTILGYKHTIKKGKAESEFIVVKDLAAEINDADD